MAVYAKHKITGKIASVSQALLDSSENLVLATEADLKADREARELKVFGYVLDKPEPATEPKPNKSWTRKQLVALAQHKKIEVDDSITKEELLVALTEGDSSGENA